MIYTDGSKIEYLLNNENFRFSDSNGNDVIMWRHGRTSYNVQRIVCGSGLYSFSLPLDDVGVAQAESQVPALKKMLSSPQINKEIILLSSDQVRAIKTAEILTSFLDVPTLEESFLREIDDGDLDAKPYGTRPFDPAKFVTVRGTGEDYVDYCRRIFNGMQSVLDGNKNKTILISTHGCTAGLINMMFGNKNTHFGNVDLIQYDKKLNIKSRSKLEALGL